MLTAPSDQIAVCLALTRAIGRTRTVEEIYGVTLDALSAGLGVARASILLFDSDGVMRFKASRGLSEGYRRAVEGHTPWTPDSVDPEPIVVDDVAADESLRPHLPAIQAEGIATMAFIPLVSLGRVLGKFMLYYDTPAALTESELQLASLIASQVAFAVERTRAEEQARHSESRLRFALDAASMGTWDWDLGAGTVQWSDNLERIHGLPKGTFDGTFGSYEREIHPHDRERVLASIQRALTTGAPHEVEYRDRRTRRHGSMGRGKGPRHPSGRNPGPHDRRVHDDHAAQAGRDRQARDRAGSQPSQGRDPGDAVARAADAAQRHPRLGADASGWRDVAGSHSPRD
jgi:PAS domain-containing protein